MRRYLIMKKRITVLMITLALIITAMPVPAAAATAPVDRKSVCYTPAADYRSGDCILSATKVMIRRAMLLRGSTKWSTISNKTIRKKATIFGLLLHRFTFETDGMSYKVRVGFFKGNTNAARIREFERLIKAHPEGVVIWGKDASVFGMHGVLLTDVKKGVPYVMDSWYNLGPRKCGIQVWDDSSMKSPILCTQYWLIKEVGLAKKTKAPDKGSPLAPTSAKSVDTKSTLTIKDQTIPSNITQGSGFGVEGVILSHLWGVSPMILWHDFCAAPSSVTTLVTEERRKGIANFRMLAYGERTHLYVHGEPPAFAARFCECFDDDTRHD